jgi:hypothetical protein
MMQERSGAPRAAVCRVCARLADQAAQAHRRFDDVRRAAAAESPRPSLLSRALADLERVARALDEAQRHLDAQHRELEAIRAVLEAEHEAHAALLNVLGTEAAAEGISAPRPAEAGRHE